MSDNKHFFCLLLFWDLFLFSCATTFILTSDQPHVSGTFCKPGSIEFTCEGIDMTSGNLFWFVDDTLVASYGFHESQNFPFPLLITPPLDGVTATVISARVDQTSFDITSLLNVSNASILNGSSLYCSDSRNSSEVIHITLGDLPLPSSPISSKCSLLPSPGGAEVTLQWSPSFTSQYAVERYRVSVNPDPSSCSSDQVTTSEDYSCSGLVLGTLYTFTVSAINCGDQEGERKMIMIQSKRPDSPNEIMLYPMFDEGSLLTATLEWRIEIETGTKSCDNNSLSYTVIVENSTDVVLDWSVNTSESCREDICSVIIPSSSLSSNVPYTFSVVATNIFGSTREVYECTISPPQLSDVAYQVLSALGGIAVVLSVLLILVNIIFLGLRLRKESGCVEYLLVSVLVVGVAFIIVSVTLWIVYGTHSDATLCEPQRLSRRDKLIFSAFALSFVSPLLMMSLTIVIIMIMYPCKKKKDGVDIEMPQINEVTFKESSQEGESKEENDKLTSFGVIKPTWKDNDKCYHCDAEFYLLWPGYGRHYCQACGESVCGTCSINQVFLQHSKAMERVCKECYKVYQSLQVQKNAKQVDVDVSTNLQPPAQVVIPKGSNSKTTHQETSVVIRPSSQGSDVVIPATIVIHKLNNSLPDIKKPSEGKESDVSSHFCQEVSQSNMMDNLVECDANNYCEIEAAPQYNITHHQSKSDTNCQNTHVPVGDFEPYSELELSQPPPSHAYELTSKGRDQRLHQSFPPITETYSAYSALEETDNKEYDATHRLGHSIKLKYPAIDTQGDDSYYSGLPHNNYDTTSHTKMEGQIKLLGVPNPDVYSSMELSHDNAVVTSKGNNTEIKPVNPGVVPNYSNV